MTPKFNDKNVLKALRKLRKSGRNYVVADEIAKLFSVDSVKALGAMERVKHKL